MTQKLAILFFLGIILVTRFVKKRTGSNKYFLISQFKYLYVVMIVLSHLKGGLFLFY